ncbi:MAG: DNA-binding protein [Clostridia bacterium]|nr:DNA-binding protein [Clostridia bacterium]
MEKHNDLSRLLDFYGDVLSDRQKLAMQLYYNDDLSLSEVAEELNISRQGVRASLKKSEEQLLFWESKLCLCALFDKTMRDIQKLHWYVGIIRERGEESRDEMITAYADEMDSFIMSIEKNL